LVKRRWDRRCWLLNVLKKLLGCFVVGNRFISFLKVKITFSFLIILFAG